MLTKRLRQEWRNYERRQRQETRKEFGDDITREIRSEEMSKRHIVSHRAKRKITHGPLT